MGYPSKIHRNIQLRTWPGSIPVQFRYTVGKAGTTFFQRLRDEGRLYGTRCVECGLTYLPPRLFCERCFAELTEWVAVQDQGELFSYTVVHRDLNGRPLEKPQVFGLVQLYGADTVFFHRILADPDYLRFGMKVRAVLLPSARRTGAITDLVGFEPVQVFRASTFQPPSGRAP